VKKATEEATTKEAAKAAAVAKKAIEGVLAGADTEKASDSTSALGAGIKRAATSMSSSSHPTK
jgi:hypothetical protein